MKKVVNILDTVFYISGEKEILNYIDYFQDCYDEGKGLVAENKINIEVHEAEVPKTINGEKIKIHTTKHDYWNFYGEYVAAVSYTHLYEKEVSIDKKYSLYLYVCNLA